MIDVFALKFSIVDVILQNKLQLYVLDRQSTYFEIQKKQNKLKSKQFTSAYSLSTSSIDSLVNVYCSTCIRPRFNKRPTSVSVVGRFHP